MKFSLIMATYGRDKEVENFLNSLKSQTYKNFELIVVDQNEDDRVYKVIKNFENEFEIKYFKVNFRGLSKARNYALKYINGDIIAFPDDDCEYPHDLLFNVKNFFDNTDYDILSVVLVDKETKKSILNRWTKKSSKITPINILRSVTSTTLFVKISRLKREDIYFDEEFGLGALYYAEDMDFVMRLLKNGARGYFNREIFIYHPNVNIENVERFFTYGKGMGAFLKKYYKYDIKFIFPFIENLIVRPIGGIILNALLLNIKGILKNYYSLLGRWKGFLIYKE